MKPCRYDIIDWKCLKIDTVILHDQTMRCLENTKCFYHVQPLLIHIIRKHHHCFSFWILNTKYHQPLLFVVIAHEKSSGFQFTLDGTISSPKQSVALADDNHRQKRRQIYPCLVRQWKLSFCQFAFNVYQSKKTAANKIFFWYHSISVRALGEKLLFL